MNNLMQAAGLEKLSLYSKLWGLIADGPPFHTRSSCLQAVRHDGVPAMLKIAMTEEEIRGARLMAWWQGAGAMRVLAQKGEALLLERACGHQSLLEMVRAGQDDEASRIICGVAARIHVAREQPPFGLMPLSSWFEALARAAESHGGVFRDAATIAADLLKNPQDSVVLHGDLHHDNVLDAGSDGWLAIDPKGLIGERYFDFANIFCNPYFEIAATPGRLMKQVVVVAEAADLDRRRLLEWIVACAALSAAWHLEDGEKPDTALAVAEIALNDLSNSVRHSLGSGIATERTENSYPVGPWSGDFQQ